VSIPFAVYNTRDVLAQNRNYYCQAVPPHVSTLCLFGVIAHDQIFQTFPLHICILQAIKYWRWEWPGNELMLVMIYLEQVLC